MALLIVLHDLSILRPQASLGSQRYAVRRGTHRARASRTLECGCPGLRRTVDPKRTPEFAN